MDKKLIQYHQLCALVKTIILQDPTIMDAEWKARARETMAKWGFQEPTPDQLSRAMASVEFALRKTIGARLREEQETAPPKSAQPDLPKETRTRRPAGWDIVVALMAKLWGQSVVSGKLLPAQPLEPRETLAITEEEALDEFWRAANDNPGGRIGLLRAFAELAIVRPASWDHSTVRDQSSGSIALFATNCFACGTGGRFDWHHVIQIQFGGSNAPRNRVAICPACHADIHPWLPSVSRRVGGWSHIAAGLETPEAIVDALRRQRRHGVA